MNLLERILLDCVTRIPPPTHSEDPRMLEARSYLEMHLKRPIGMPDVCDAVGLSRSRLTHLFKATYRQTPMMFLEKLRLDLAANHLACSSDPIADIALMCGFTDPLYFSRRFRKYSGLAPNEYRQRNRTPMMAS